MIWNIFNIVLISIVTVCMAVIIIGTVKGTKNLKNYADKVKVISSPALSIIWIVISLVNILAGAMNLSEKRELIYLTMTISWTFILTMHTMAFFTRDCYITSEGVLQRSSTKITPKENYKYRINGDTLELYYKQNDTPVKYRITEDKEELVKMLDENYVQKVK